MFNKKAIRKNVVQIYSLTIKDLKLKGRYKSEFFVENFLPFLTLFFPFIIFNTLFHLKSDFFEGSYYSVENYILFLLLAYSVECSLFLLWYYRDLFYDEKSWKTLNSIMVAPVSKFNVLIGFFISGLLTRVFSIIFTIIICYILFPIPLATLIFVLIVLFCITLTFAGMGFILGLFEIVNENVSASLSIGISFIALVSCLFYPIEIFPEQLHIIILLNPLYYYFDLLKLSWWAGINYYDAMSYITINHIIIVGFCTILTPLIASILFLKIYHRYGASGY
ncbi:MAG: ABC transporter permease [Candidatus Thorarchaeota archaeon]